MINLCKKNDNKLITSSNTHSKNIHIRVHRHGRSQKNAHLEYSVAEAELGGGDVEVVGEGGDAACTAVPSASDS